jgi:hypothetical protein
MMRGGQEPSFNNYFFLVVFLLSVVEASGVQKSGAAQGNDLFYRARSSKLKPTGITRFSV